MGHANDLDAPLGGLRTQRLGVRIVQYCVVAAPRAQRRARMSRQKGTCGDRIRLGNGRNHVIRIVRMHRGGIARSVRDNGNVIRGRRGIDDFLATNEDKTGGKNEEDQTGRLVQENRQLERCGIKFERERNAPAPAAGRRGGARHR